MLLVFILAFHSVFFGLVFYHVIFTFDKRYGRKKSYFYMLLRFIPIFLFSITSGLLVRSWPDAFQHFVYFAAQWAPGIVTFLILSLMYKKERSR